MSFFDEILLAEQLKNNATHMKPLPSPSRSMEIILSSKNSISKTFSSNKYIQIIPAKSFPSLASLCINHLFKKYSRKCNTDFCKFRNAHIHSTYSFVKICDTISNSNINQSISSSEESIYYSRIITPKDFKYLGSINELNISLGQGYYDYLKQSDLSYLNSKLQYLISKKDENDCYIDISNSPSTSQSNSNLYVLPPSSSSSLPRHATIDNSRTIASQSESSPFSLINNDLPSSSTSLSIKSKKGKQSTGITKFRHLIGRSSIKNEKEKNKGSKSSSITAKGKNKSKKSSIHQSKEKAKEEESMPPIYNNGKLYKSTRVSYQSVNSTHESINNSISFSSFPNSHNSLNSDLNFTSTSITSSVANINKSSIHCIHALYSLIKTLPEYTQYAFKHALICDVCGNNYVTNESLKYFRSQYHQSIRSLAKKTIHTSPYQQESDEHLNRIEEQDIQNIIQDYGSLRILCWNQPTEHTIDGEEINQNVQHPTAQPSINTITNNNYTISLDSSNHVINGSESPSSSLSSSSSSSSISLQALHDDLNTKSFENLIPFNYRICSHSCMIKLIDYLNLHYD
ncbi:hypothetical protein BCR36DRAFT_582328 [Piromyces finnis]|uniref:Uncharacterized protein n=1 Tax=Piromyces finnis TaxID=1754191 RepID=A0A1Y1VDR8_9FUNG|nr:hypothetical protein BCR36DRAFT_582328 [Piromyces finnis]|eukprot:ORX52924.1 hypothetical protein BCR36DRAFT_582328 [Piromyces finnis]